MDRRPDMDALAAAKRRQYVKKEKRKHRILAALLTVTILAVWGIIIFALYSLWAPVSLTPVTEGTTASTPEITTARTSTGTVVTEAPRTQSLTLTADDVHRGDLILVSTLLERAYVFPKDESDLVTLYGNKSDSYRVSSSAIKLSRTTMAALDAMFDASLPRPAAVTIRSRRATARWRSRPRSTTTTRRSTARSRVRCLPPSRATASITPAWRST